MGNALPQLKEAVEGEIAPDTENAAQKALTIERLSASLDFKGLTKKAASLEKVRGLLVKAAKAYKRQDFNAAALRALEATRIDEDCSQACHILALALEGMGELYKALQMYERALALDPEDPEIYLNVGLVASKLRMLEGAEKMFRIYISMAPHSHQGYNNLGGILRDQQRFDESIDLLRNAISQFPTSAELWNTIGTVAMEQSSVHEARLFYEEAMRLEPNMPRVYHNVGYAVSHTGPLTEALAYYDKALKLMGKHPDSIEARHGRAQTLVGLGRLEEGWKDWEVRHDQRFRGSMIYAIPAPRWQGEDLAGKRLLVMGEQGLGDEILFSVGYRDLIAQLGPEGKLIITADPRLTTLLQRSFPQAEMRAYADKRHNGKGVRICPWLNEENTVDYFSTNGSTLRFVRPTVESFAQGYADGRPLLIADPARVAYWRGEIEALGEGPYVGFCWRSMITSGSRKKYFAPLPAWKPVLNQKVRFINLQYGDCKDELAFFAEKLGVTVHNFPQIDLKNDLDELAALGCALDLVISAPTASAALAAASGTETWLPAIGYSWTQLGTDHYPFYPKSRGFWPEEYGDWPAVMVKVSEALAAFAVEKRAQP
jgi:tetratricopeptide (TPR) repeat protein